MKKFFLPLLLFPVVAFAQSNAPSFKAAITNVRSMPTEHDGMVQTNSQSSAAPNAPVKTGGHKPVIAPDISFSYNPTTIGYTTYGLQTNGAIAKRLQLYSGGNLSAVWIYSDAGDGTFANRYSGYGSYNGTKWSSGPKIPQTHWEFDRSGWPNIGVVTTNGHTYEILTSHYAAAGSTSLAGGIYWYANSAVGKSDFQKVIDFSNNRDSTQNLLWPRMATSGGRIYLIGTYQGNGPTQSSFRLEGVNNPVAYYCYNTNTGKWVAKHVPLIGFDSTRYSWCQADEYSIDARDKYVAILIGGTRNDLSLWKSSDSGETFTKTIIDSFKYAPYDIKNPTTYADTVLSNDGTGTVSLDANGVAHVAFSPMLSTNPNGDSFPSLFVSNHGVVYWNDKDRQFNTVGTLINYLDPTFPKAGFGQPLAAFNIPTQNFNGSAAYAGNLCNATNVACDAHGNIYVVYSAPHQDDLDASGFCFRHIYCSVFNGTKWLDPQDIAQTSGKENSYPTVARDADDKLHVMFMQGYDYAGIDAPTTNGQTSNPVEADSIIYLGISTSDLLNGKFGLYDAGIKNNVNSLFSLGTIFPNPANTQVNISLNMKQSSEVSIKLYSVVGQEMQSKNYSMLPFGPNRLSLDVSTLPAGVYICNVTAGGYTTTQRIVIER